MFRTSKEELSELIEFVDMAAKRFSENPDLSTVGHVLPGSWLALRWGICNDGVLVVRIDETFEPFSFPGVARSTREE